MQAGVQPGAQAGLGVAQVDIGHPDLGKSALTRPLAQLPQQLPSVALMPHAHAAILETRQLRWPDEAACGAAAASLARRPELADACIELHGPLGAGKTTFSRHLLRALGVQGRIKSPTYAVLEPYDWPGRDGHPISHLDFYRFDDAREGLDAGLRDVFAAPGLKLVEWPDKVRGLLPLPDLALHLEPAGPDADARRVRADALTPRGRALLGALP